MNPNRPNTTSTEPLPSDAPTKSPEERLAELRASKDKRDEAERQLAVANELEELELEERFCRSHGKRGQGFQIINATNLGAGFFVVRPPEAVLLKKFFSIEGDPSPEDVHELVAPCIVHPTRNEYNTAKSTRPLIANRCAGAIMDLAGAAREVRQKKY